MPYDGQWDPEVQEVADDNESTYQEAHDTKEDSEEPGLSQRARDEVLEDNVRDAYEKQHRS